MLAKMKDKSQVTIPKSIVDQLGLKTGDSFDVSESGGVITIIPMELYPKPAMQKAREAFSKISIRDTEAMQAIEELFGFLSDTSMSSVAFAASKQDDLSLE